MNNYFVILAAGKSKRFHKKIAKQFYIYKNKEIIDHSVEKALDSKLFEKIIIVTNDINHFKKKKYPKQIIVINQFETLFSITPGESALQFNFDKKSFNGVYKLSLLNDEFQSSP